MKRCLVLSDSFKGTLSSPDICRIARSLHIPGWHIDALPVADGGEGTTDCFLDACGGQRIALPVSGPFGGTIDGFYGLLPDGTAVVECAAAAGLHQAEGRPDPEAATTYGVGQLLAHALDHGAKRLILGLGGSCTNDGGCGAAAALGVRFYDRQGRGFVPTGGTLADIEAIDLSGRHPGLRPGVLTVMCDIDNPLYGETGAAYIFAPQKGANDACVQRLDSGLRHLAAVLHAQLGAEVDTLPGGGGAGGVGAGGAGGAHPAARICPDAAGRGVILPPARASRDVYFSCSAEDCFCPSRFRISTASCGRAASLSITFFFPPYSRIMSPAPFLAGCSRTFLSLWKERV